MTNTERNNALLQYCAANEHLDPNLTPRFMSYLEDYTSPTTTKYVNCTYPIYIKRLRAFIIRGKRDKYKKIVLMLAQKLADSIESMQDVTCKTTQPTNLQLLQEIERLKRQVISNSPSEHAELSQATRDRLAEVRCALKFLLKRPDLTMILSLDRIRILKSDLVYLEKRSHLFDATHALIKSKV